LEAGFAVEMILKTKPSAVPVVVYQMGKVGSMALVASLERQGVGPVYHLHALNPAGERPQQAARLVYEEMVLAQRPAKFIALVRETIARNVSAFFQEENFVRHTGQRFAEFGGSLEELARLFGSKLHHMSIFPLTWFDRQVKQVLGIDVYAEPFDRSRGFVRLGRGAHELLVLKSELDDRSKAAAVATFLNLDGFEIERANVGGQKAYAEVYRRFRESIRLPDTYIEGILSSRYMRHFYSEQEIERFRAYWSDPDRSLPVEVGLPVGPSVA
jgi:hypothetical protein